MCVCVCVCVCVCAHAGVFIWEKSLRGIVANGGKQVQNLVTLLRSLLC